jgi:hypothetical protein
VLRGLWRRLRRRREAAPEPSSEREPEPSSEREPDDHVPGRAHLVFDDGSIVEADMDAETRAKVEYLARRAVAPPPPDA